MKLATVIFSLVAVSASATVVSTEAIEQLASKAPLIVRGTVKSSVSLWANSREIVTRTELQVDEVLKGKAPASLTLQQPGGTVDGLTAAVSGTAHFTANESVVVFLEPLPQPANASKTDAPIFVVLSLTAGKVLLEAESSTAKISPAATSKGKPALKASRDLTGLVVYDQTSPSKLRKTESVESLGEASAFLSSLRKLLKGAR